MKVGGKEYRTVWLEGGTVRMIDQSALPHHFRIRDCSDHAATARAIRDMITRGAGALGVAAGYAMAQACLEAPEARFRAYLDEARALIEGTRPTAQNLFYCVRRVHDAARARGDQASARAAAVKEANALADEDVASALAIGRAGNDLLRDGMRVLTHCNAGWLAFADWGTALAPVYVAHRQGKRLFVWVDETRPRLQGAALTAWELGQEGVPFALIADNAAGHFMRRGEVDLAIVGADRIARNGDVANKIGTYEKALLAREHGIPFYVAAPLSTVDWACSDGGQIPIEERDPRELLCVRGLTDGGELAEVAVAAADAKARNPAFDVTPARLITGILTDRGLISPENLTDLEP